jgi:hypothetical protein
VLARAGEVVPDDVFNRERLSIAPFGGAGGLPSRTTPGAGGGDHGAARARPRPPPPRPKRSTERGEAREKLIAALTRHHRYAGGGPPNLEPINNNELARLADASPSTASELFEREFTGHAAYKALCRRDPRGLVLVLKKLNDDLPGRELLYGRRPAGEGAPRRRVGAGVRSFGTENRSSVAVAPGTNVC